MVSKIQVQLRYIIIYSGTTVENYRTCVFIDHGKVFFDKRREPRHQHRRFYFDKSFSTATLFALDCANSRIHEHTPLLMEGYLLEDLLQGYGSLDVGELFPVGKVWVPKAEIDWHHLRPFMDKDLKDKFIELDPKELLSK